MYDVVEITGFPLEASRNPVAWQVNAAGLVIGYVERDAGDVEQIAFLWNPTTPRSPITWINADEINSLPAGLNNPGQVVGWTANDLSGEGRTAFLWNPPGISAPALNLPGVDQQALAINDAGQVVGWYEQTEKGAHTAFLWDPKHGRQDLPSLGGNTSSQAHGIGDRGLIVGRSGAQPGVDEVGQAVLWIPGVPGSFELVRLNTLPNWVSVAVAINQFGAIVGWGYPNSTNFSQAHALYWPTSTAQMQDLGTLGGSASFANGINHAGEVVGNIADAFGGATRALYWHGGQLVDLNDQIDPNSGWVLQQANGINDDGIIVGAGTLHGRNTAFELTPRQPSHLPSLADRLRQAVVAELTQILYGLTTDGGGAVISPGGVPTPVPPWTGLSASTKDLLLGLVMSEVGSLVQDPTARTELRRASLNLVRREVERQIRALEREAER